MPRLTKDQLPDFINKYKKLVEWMAKSKADELAMRLAICEALEPSYGVKLDGQHFASGETASEFTVPADGDAQFAISVDLDLLQTAPQLLFIVRQGIRQDISYELEGYLALDIPLTSPVKYRSRGTIRLRSDSF